MDDSFAKDLASRALRGIPATRWLSSVPVFDSSSQASQDTDAHPMQASRWKHQTLCHVLANVVNGALGGSAGG